MGMMTSHILWKIIQMFQTTNQSIKEWINGGLMVVKLMKKGG
jgi:hypothetical protein